MHVFSRSVRSNSVISCTATCQAPLLMRFFREEYWSGLPYLSPGHLPDPGIKHKSLCHLHWQAGSLPLAPPGKPVKNKEMKYKLDSSFPQQSQCPFTQFFFFFFLILILYWSIVVTMLCCFTCTAKCFSYIYICIYMYLFFFQILFPFRLLQNIKPLFQCYTIGPYGTDIYILL